MAVTQVILFCWYGIQHIDQRMRVEETWVRRSLHDSRGIDFPRPLAVDSASHQVDSRCFSR